MRLEFRRPPMGVAAAAALAAATLVAVAVFQQPYAAQTADGSTLELRAPHEDVATLQRIRPLLLQLQKDVATGNLSFADAVPMAHTIIAGTPLEFSLSYFAGATAQERLGNMLVFWIAEHVRKSSRSAAVMSRVRAEFRSCFGKETSINSEEIADAFGVPPAPRN